jgi:hypothetical protein
VKGMLAMSEQSERAYHARRVLEELKAAESATDPDVRAAHEELARKHMEAIKREAAAEKRARHC